MSRFGVLLFGILLGWSAQHWYGQWTASLDSRPTKSDGLTPAPGWYSTLIAEQMCNRSRYDC